MKPYVICHMCTSIDGRILGERWRGWPRPAASARLFEKTAASFGVNAWLVGTTTMREFMGRPIPLRRARAGIPRTDYLAKTNDARGFAIGADAHGVLRFQRPDIDGDHIVLLISQRVSNAYLAHLRAAGVSYLFCGKDRVDLRVALDQLARQLGLKRLMLEGGGTFNGAMLRAGLVDEISQVILPFVDGGTPVSTMFDIPGPPPRAVAALRPIRHRRLPGGVQWFRYRVRGSARRRG